MKMTESLKPAPVKQPAKSKVTPARRSRKPAETLVPPKVVYALYGLVALSLVMNIFAAVTFVSYTRSLSVPFTLDISEATSDLATTAGWLPPGAEDVRPAEPVAKKADLDSDPAPPAKSEVKAKEAKKEETARPPSRP